MKRSILLCVGIAVAVPIFLYPRLAQGEDVIFQKVAGPNVEAPGGGTYQSLFSASLDQERTAFQATTSLWVEGVWAHESGQAETIADTETLIPGSVVHFAGFGDHAQYEGETIFFGHYPEWCDIGACGGIYHADDGGLSLVVDTNATVPDRSETYEYLGEPAIGADGVAYRGGMVDDPQGYPEYLYGIYADLGAGPVTVADWDTPTPYGTGHLYFDYYEGHIGVYEGEVYFHAYNTGNYLDGYYAWDPVSDTYRVLRNANTPVPGTQSYFDWARADNFRNGSYAFIGHYWSNEYHQGVYVDFGDGLIEIVNDDELSSAWYGGEIEFEYLAVNGDTVAFTAYDYWYYGTNRLYLYRRSDETLYPIIGSGDTLEGRIVERVELYFDGASEDSVAFIVQFRDHWERELYVASLHTPANDMIAGPDTDANGYGEVILLRQQPGTYKYQLQVRDASSGGMTAMIGLGDFPVYDIALVENPGQAPHVAVYSKNTVNGQLLVKLYSLPGGAMTRKLKLWKDMRPIAMTVLPDMNGNGAVEIAAMAESSKPFIRLQVLDTGTGELLNAIVHGKSARPVAIYTAGDMNASGTPEIVIRTVVRSTAKVRLIVQDAADDTIVSDFFAGFNDKAPVTDAMMVDDMNGDGLADFVMARERPAQGKAGYEIRDLLTGAVISDRIRGSDSRPVSVVGIADMSADGKGELGLLTVESDGVTAVEIHDMVTLSRLDTIDMLAIEDGSDLITTPDIDANAAEELVVMGKHFDMDLLEIHDCVNGDPLRYYFIL